MKKSQIVLTKATNNSSLGRCKTRSYQVSHKATHTEEKQHKMFYQEINSRKHKESEGIPTRHP